MHMSWIKQSKWSLFSLVLACGVGVTACVGEVPDEDLDEASEMGEEDPAGEMNGEELWDEGPPVGEDVVDGEDDAVGSTSQALSTSVFQLPFPCGQVWAGQTRSNHSPVNSVDFNRANDEGDTVVAAAAGTISRVANEGSTSYGKWIEINHGDGYTTRYAHLSVQSVSVGQSVSKGQKIGNVGNTGGSTGAHLHYELRLNGTAIKPVFNGATALFYGTKNYTSNNSCGGGGSSGVKGTVNTSGISLTIRSAASTSSTAVGSVADGATVNITCQKQGTSVTGTYGTTTLWDYIGSGYVSDAYIHTGSDGQVAPTCQ
ncbi:metalloendopeptidase Membrane protein [Chondromyces apiculatus DSM 436]|uniref:Metalloendopeptidase Membrane protein n=2 Tax=Chondromyces apiculatus TaxID=51 RepID=A0A017T854_9BACT|nr:metalloendopeptidase Membrane protein [Chondromyces apiculatus DSM 436]